MKTEVTSGCCAQGKASYDEIEFRGKRMDNGEWVYGYYFQGFTGIAYILVLHDHILHVTEFYEVIPETVGRFKGTRDKYGTKIYEGDVVEVVGNIHDSLEPDLPGREVIFSIDYNKNDYMYENLGDIMCIIPDIVEFLESDGTAVPAGWKWGKQKNSLKTQFGKIRVEVKRKGAME